jgi:hypothetical protein
MISTETDRFAKVIGCLGATIQAVSRGWTNTILNGWGEVPESRASEGSAGPDLWSTCQAAEILACSLTHFRQFVLPVDTDAEFQAKQAILSALPLLLRARTGASTMSDALPVGFGSAKKRDVIGLVWRLRTMGAVLSANTELGLSPTPPRVSKQVETILHDLFILQDPNGAWSSFGDVGKSCYVTGMVVWAIGESYPALVRFRHLRPHRVHGTHIAVEWLLRNRVLGSGIPFFEGGRTASVSRTAIASLAMQARREMRCPEPLPEQELAINTASVGPPQEWSGAVASSRNASRRLAVIRFSNTGWRFVRMGHLPRYRE